MSKSLAQFSFRGNGGQGEEILLMEVDSTSSGPGIDALIAGEADIAMSSRGAKPDEVRALLAQGRGNLLDVSQEYIVAVDSVLMIVHESNPINELSRNQLRDIYAGRISNWSDVGGPNLPIVLIGRDGGSARENFEAWTFDGPATLSPNFIEVDGGKDMTRRVMAEPGGIGYTINDNVLEAKPIDLILDCGLRMEATNFKTKAEEYMLGRRIRLYVDKGPHAPEVQKLLDLMISPSVDGLTADSGYTDLGIDRDEKGLERLVQAALVGQPDRTILNAVDRMQVDLRGAVRLSMTFRFETASWDLDRKALRDMDRLAKTLANPEYEGKEIIFVGFADARGEFDYNVWLSKGRSQSVLDEIRSRADAGALRGRDLVAKGFGEMAPMGCNDTVEGLSRNRRVEVWVR